MRRYLLWCGVALLAVVPARAQEAPAAKVVLDVWDAAYLEGAKAGYWHTTVREIDYEGGKAFRTTRTMDLTIKRYKAVVNQRLEMSTVERPGGAILALSMTQYLDGGRQVTQAGRVAGDKLIVTTPNDPAGREVPWDGKALGLYQQELVLAQRKVKPGDTFAFRDYPLPLLTSVRMTVEVKKPEVEDVLTTRKDDTGTKVERLKKSLLRVEVTPDKVKVGGGDIQLPKMVLWLDDKYTALRTESEMPGLGKMTLYRTSRDVAEKEGAAPALLPDLGLTTLVSLKRPIERPHEAKEIVYRITVKGDDDPTTAFARDARQEVRNVKGHTFELVVRAAREPAAGAEAAPPGKEFLESSYFLDSADARVRRLAARVVGAETDPLAKARRIEKWVSDNMRLNSGLGFPPASQVCRDLQGDCRQHAMLAAALCRAVGVPARTAVGLVYVDDPERGPVLGFHMWTEVWVRGQWFGVDATLGRGSVGAGHLKIIDHSWRDIQTLAPLLPVTRVLGKIQVEVVSVK
jgi:transglutaminase-like putative cysteine protease